MLSVPNAHVLRMRPQLIRYVLVFQTTEGPKITTTYRHTEKILENFQTERVWLIDLVREKMEVLDDVRCRHFMSEWKVNYLNPDWEY